MLPSLPLPLLGGIFSVLILGVVVILRQKANRNPSHPDWKRSVDQEAVHTGPPPTPQQFQTTDTGAWQNEYRARMERATANFEKELAGSLKSLQSGLVQNLNQVQKSHGQFLANLEEMANTEQKNTMQHVSTKINELLLNFEQNLTGFLSDSEQKSLEAINLEVRSARQLIDAYKAQQLAIVDENIVSVLEKTLEIVLKEKLTLKNQVDLVYDALEKAKVEKFFV